MSSAARSTRILDFKTLPKSYVNKIEYWSISLLNNTGILNIVYCITIYSTTQYSYTIQVIRMLKSVNLDFSFFMYGHQILQLSSIKFFQSLSSNKSLFHLGSPIMMAFIYLLNHR